MSKTYYARAGEFANALIVEGFKTRKERDAWVNDEPQSGVGSHYQHGRQAATRREAEALCAYNRRMSRDYRRGYGSSECFGTTELPKP